MRRAGYAAEGMDLSPAMVAAATEAYGPFFHCGDLLDRSAADLYDGILLFAVLQHVLPEDAPAAFDSLARQLSPGGILLVVAKEGTGLTEDLRLGRKYPRHSVLYSAVQINDFISGAALKSLLTEQFSTTRAGKCDRWVGVLAQRPANAAQPSSFGE